MRSLVTPVIALAVLASGCTGGSDSDTPSAIVPVGLTTLATPDIFEYDASPDGTWLAVSGENDSVCLVPADEVDDGIRLDSPSAGTVCSSQDAGNVVRWSPDSGRVVISDFVFRFFRSAPLTVLETDGTETELVPAVPDEDRIIGTAFGPAFLDAETVIFGRVLDDPPHPEYSTIAVDGSDEQVLVEFSNPTGDDAWLPFHAPVADENALLVTIGDDISEPIDIWSVTVDGAAPTQLTDAEQAADEPARPGNLVFAPVDLAERHALVVDANSWGDFLRLASEFPMFSLVDRSDGTIVPIENRTSTDAHQFATLSPNGEYLATVSVDIETRGDSTVLITPVDALLDGEPAWEELPLEDRAIGSRDLGSVARSMHWDLDDTLLLETADELLQIELEIEP